MAKKPPAGSGERLREEWDIPARQVLFHKDGRFYNLLTKFPAALSDLHGYVLFKTEDALRSAVPPLRIGKKIDVPGGISSLRRPRYKVMVESRDNLPGGDRCIRLAADVATMFPTSGEANAALRLLMRALKRC